jgi:hypothetical protein
LDSNDSSDEPPPPEYIRRFNIFDSSEEIGALIPVPASVYLGTGVAQRALATWLEA